jgi:hypothetical protein
MAGMEITPELAEKVLRGGPDAIAVVRGIYQTHVEKLDALELEARKIRDAAALLPLVWIPVGERLPDIGVSVLCSSKEPPGEDLVWIGQREQYEWYFPGANEMGEPTHWMPLPEPPEVK